MHRRPSSWRDHNRSAVIGLYTGNDVQQRRFPAARRANYADEFTLLDAQAYVVENGELGFRARFGKLLRQVAHGDSGGERRSRSDRRWRPDACHINAPGSMRHGFACRQSGGKLRPPGKYPPRPQTKCQKIDQDHYNHETHAPCEHHIDARILEPPVVSPPPKTGTGHHLRQRNQLMARSGRGALRRVLNGAINASLVSPNMQARFDGLGAEPMIMTPAEFRKFIVDETEKWANVIKFTGIKPVMRLVGTARRDQPRFTSMKARAGATLSRSQVETAHQGYLPA